MIVHSAAEFLAAYTAQRFPATHPATARGAFLVAPLGFTLAQESARDNSYMANHAAQAAQTDPARALTEHAALAAALRTSVPVIVFPGDATTPDAVFPNNVFATT
ncbi:MAG: amidinotransferase, partial [Gammaproteobacteria bacterium]